LWQDHAGQGGGTPHHCIIYQVCTFNFLQGSKILSQSFILETIFYRIDQIITRREHLLTEKKMVVSEHPVPFHGICYSLIHLI
jgi:hypothetical protein